VVEQRLDQGGLAATGFADYKDFGPPLVDVGTIVHIRVDYVQTQRFDLNMVDAKLSHCMFIYTISVDFSLLLQKSRLMALCTIKRRPISRWCKTCIF
jgi:hypothetical protein